MTPSRRPVRLSLACLAAGLAAGLISIAPLQATIEGINWFPIGPAPEADFFDGGVSGRATAVAVNPMNVDDIWLGTSQGGVWHSTDGGVTWRPTSDSQASLAIGAISLAGCTSSGCTRIYAGTGENGIRRDTFYGKGLLVGAVSNVVEWTLRNGQPTYDFSLGSIFNVVLDRATTGASQVLYITLSSGVTASASESTVTAPEPSPGGYGIYKSIDNAAHFTKLTVSGAAGFRPSDLEIDPTDSNVLYAGFMGRGLFKSTDAGASWCPLNPGIPKPMGCPAVSGLPNPGSITFDHVEIDIFRGDHQTLYASFGMCPDRILQDCYPSVYKSTNGGGAWTQMFTGSTTACPRVYSRYTHPLTVHPTVGTTVFLGGVHLCKSTDSGQNWSVSEANTLGGIIHLDHHAIVFHQTSTSRVYDVNDGGVAVSMDGGTNWTPRNDDLQTIGFQGIATSPLTARVIGGAQDNSGMLWYGARIWDWLPCCGDGGFAIMDRDDVMKMYVTSNTPGPPVSVFPRRSSDGGVSFTSAINTGLPASDPRSFYSPFIQDPSAPHPLYFGTNRLFKSTDDASNWTPVSPVLSTTPETEIFSGVDVITAIAVAPSNPSRVYIGYYSGKVFVTDAACTATGCWPLRSTGLPAAPITWIAVHPTQPDTAYATLSGFGAGIHVYKTTNTGMSWSATGSLAELNGVPANTIAVEPADPNRLWLGTDKGIYKSLTAGGSWFRFSAGLPNVPVFEISIDATRNRVVAGTHGRGAFILTEPFLSNYEGWVGGGIWDIPVYGNAFLPNQTCTMKILRQNGTICATGTTDAIGGVIETDDSGVLVTTAGGFYIDRPVAWACVNGNCLGGTNISACNQPGNPITTVVAICGPQVGIDNILGCPPLANPPSSWMTLTGLPGGFFTPGPDAASKAALYSPAVVGGSFQLLPAVQVGDGSSEVLCSVDVPFTGTETDTMVLEAARDAVNSDPLCGARGVTAEVVPAALDTEIEDLFPHPGNLRLVAPGLTGAQLVPSLASAPGQATGLCFSFDRLGTPLTNQVRIMKIHFFTPTGGARGGNLVLRERSGLGNCAVTVPTAAGQAPIDIAMAFEMAFQAPGIPGPNPACPSDVNPRDVSRAGDTLITVLASEIEICSNDPGVGVAVAPDELCFADLDCNDGNPCTKDTCDRAAGRCHNNAQPNGTPCTDTNACTHGNVCINGVCGETVTCNDGNPCTSDACDPATGQCQFSPVVCDDANDCTRDSCNGQNGQCFFMPTVGMPCDDGNACTMPDTCVFDSPTGFAHCQGSPKCADSDPCTADLCSPATGTCLNQAIQCNDGNPCTTDFCQSGTCGSTPVFGQSCDDGNRCTSGDTCLHDANGLPFCQGQANSCDDQNACTVDQCNPVTGGCEHGPVPLSEVQGLQFTTNTLLTWSATPGASHSNTYRGTIPKTLLGSRLPPGPVYDHRCFESDDANGDGALASKDGQDPPLGTAFYYDVTQEGTCGEGPIGTDSDGTVIPNPFPCPTPP